MRRVSDGGRSLLAAVALVLAAAVGAELGIGGSTDRTAATKLTVWVGWSAGTELISFKKLVSRVRQEAQPTSSINVVGGINDNKIIAALRAGNAPDVVSSFSSQNVGIYCPSGGWIDLGPYLKKDHINTNIFPAASRYYTQYKGKRCALPLLADSYGFYYNKTLFKAGRPDRACRRRSRELTAYAKKLTVKNSRRDAQGRRLRPEPDLLPRRRGHLAVRDAHRRDVLRQATASRTSSTRSGLGHDCSSGRRA